MSKLHKLGKIVMPLNRKIVTAVLSSFLFTSVLSAPDWFEGDLFFNLYYLNFLFVITFGIVGSFFSDWVSKKLTNRVYMYEIISFLSHCLLGLALALPGLISAILFFMVDRTLRRVKISWLSVLVSLAIVVFVFILLLNT